MKMAKTAWKSEEKRIVKKPNSPNEHSRRPSSLLNGEVAPNPKRVRPTLRRNWLSTNYTGSAKMKVSQQKSNWDFSIFSTARIWWCNNLYDKIWFGQNLSLYIWFDIFKYLFIYIKNNCQISSNLSKSFQIFTAIKNVMDILDLLREYLV